MAKFFKSPSRCFAALVVLAILWASRGVPSPRPVMAKGRGRKSISMDFDQVDIRVFIKFISELTGKNFVVDNRIRGKVTVLSPTKISVEEAYKVFESVLEVHGFTTIPAGRVIKVVPSAAARQKSVETRKIVAFVAAPEDRVITQITPLKYAHAQDVRKVLMPLVSKQGLVVAYDPTDILIIADYQSNIRRLLHIIEEIDVESREAIVTVLSLKYANAEKLAEKLSKLVEFKQRRRRGLRPVPPLKIVPYERINVLIVLADRQNIRLIEGLVKKLDQPTPKGAGNIQVVYLENARAEELAKVLTGLPARRAPKGKKPIISPEVKIVADKATNSLVITAKPEEFKVLNPIIKKLDIPRKQVYVEALIMEVSSERAMSLGINWNVAGSANLDKASRDAVVFAGSNPGGPPSLISTDATTGLTQLSMPSGLAVGALAFPFTVEMGGTKVLVNNFSALIKAVQTDTDFNIISTPQLMTLDNEKASVVVADNIPFITRTGTLEAGVIPTQNFEYKDVGVTLKITPQINEKRFVKLKIFQEVSRVVERETKGGILAPSTRKRTAETNVEVKDGETVVIAGLIEQDSTATRSAVPCLGNVPLVGWVFKSKSNTRDRTNLLVFLTPHIVASPAEAEAIYRKKAKYMEDVQKEAVSNEQ